MNESRYWIWLSHIYGIGPRSAKQLIERFDSPRGIFELAKNPNAAFDEMKPNWKDKLTKAASEAYIDDIMANLQKRGIRAVTPADEAYPPLLAEIYDPPLALYIKGGGSLEHEKPLAVIGTRNPSAYGVQCARHFGRELAEQGFCIVSGMARGVDAEAHRGALESGAETPTIAVLGGGVDMIYPAGNERLYHKIIERGLVIAESVPGTAAMPGNFPARNRIISGLSLGVLVIEASTRSGTNITVNEALDQGREVMALPGRITDPTSEGTNAMLKSHASLVTSAADVVEALGFAFVPEYEETDVSGLSEGESAIYAQLKTGQKTTDELADITSISIAELNSSLTSLEIRGIIRQLPGRLFTLPLK